MFNSLFGTITGKAPQKLFIETHGIEWDVCVPESALDKFPPVGENARVYTWLQHTDALMTLFGFFSEADRALFFELIKVDGIGPRGALKIMGSIDSSGLLKLLDSEDIASLQKVPGVGKKTAQKMLLQLKGKLSIDDSTSAVVHKKVSAYEDIIVALSDMGYDRKRAEETVERVARILENDSDFINGDASVKETLLLKRSIVELV